MLDELWTICERYKFVASVTGAVRHDKHRDNRAFRHRVDGNLIKQLIDVIYRGEAR